MYLIAGEVSASVSSRAKSTQDRFDFTAKKFCSFALDFSICIPLRALIGINEIISIELCNRSREGSNECYARENSAMDLSARPKQWQPKVVVFGFN
jgi:hypothetical protein